MTKQKILHFDSINAQLINNKNDVFQARFPLLNPLQNIKKVSLKSCEITNYINNVRAVGTMNRLLINIGGTVYGFIIQENNYNLTTLLTAINNSFIGVVAGTTLNMTSTNGYIQMTMTGTQTNFYFVDTVLSKNILGFDNTPAVAGFLKASKKYVLNVDNYINMFIKNVNTDNADSTGKNLSTFKIPLNSNNGDIYYLYENSTYLQNLNITNETLYLTYLDIYFYDRFGNELIQNLPDYSFTLCFELDEC